MICLGLFLTFIFIISYMRKRNIKAQNEVEAQFWRREQEANNTRRQDISGLPYLTIPLDKFPIGKFQNSKIRELEQTLDALSRQQILNLNGQTNTDLKLAYGPANLPVLTECDQNFITLCRTLPAYAEALREEHATKEAQTVLEYGISCGSDSSRNFTLLGEIYQEQGDTAALDDLIATADGLSCPMKASILRKLNELRSL